MSKQVIESRKKAKKVSSNTAKTSLKAAKKIGSKAATAANIEDRLELPEIDIPKIEEFQLDLFEIDLSSLDLPKIEEINLPAVPDLSKVEDFNLNLPEVKLEDFITGTKGTHKKKGKDRK
jgi:hypothetical protein